VADAAANAEVDGVADNRLGPALKAVEAAPRLARLNDRQSGPSSRPWADSHTEPDQAGNFIRGLSIALPLSISLWAFMIWGISVIW
jgi:hypothetical protein